MKYNHMYQFFADGDIIDRTGADALINPELANEIMQGAVENSAVLTMGRRLANMSSKTYRIPVLDMLPVAGFVNGDNGKKPLSKVEWDKKIITAEEIAVIIPIPEAVLDDADYDIWGQVKPRITEAFGKVIDEAILFGVNKPSTWRSDIVATAKAAGNALTETGDVYKDVMGVGGTISMVEDDGYFVNGHIAAIGLRSKLRGLVDNTGRPIFNADLHSATNYTLDGSRIEFPRNGAFDPSKATMISGDFSQLVYSIRQDITFKLFTEGVIQNADGSIAYNLMQNDMVALRAVMRLGWEIPNPVNAIKANKAQRAPFAVLEPSI